MAVKDTSPIRRLCRSNEDRILAGVCGGLGEYFGINTVLIRLIWVIVTLAGGSGILFYILAWIFIPRKPWSVQ